jgi:hypothetical protein
MDVGEVMVNDAALTPPKLTLVTPSRLTPVIVTMVPSSPLAGVKFVTDGFPGGMNIKPYS